MTNAILLTQNESWGFFGAASRFEFDAASPEEAWALAFQAVSKATGADDEDIRLFLDSRHGRHFADNVANKLYTGDSMKKAIDAATTRWMGWTISCRTSRDTGIPAGLAYLTGFVANAGIEAELQS